MQYVVVRDQHTPQLGALVSQVYDQHEKAHAQGSTQDVAKNDPAPADAIRPNEGGDVLPLYNA